MTILDVNFRTKQTNFFIAGETISHDKPQKPGHAGNYPMRHIVLSSGKLTEMKRVQKIAPMGLAAVLSLCVVACATTPKVEVSHAADKSECVVLLHGLNRSWRAMRPMAAALADAGFTTVNVDYPSQAGPIEELVPLSVDEGVRQCRDSGSTRIHFVTHSMGGILLRYAHHKSPIADIGRVVMLAPPNQGSELVDAMRDWPGAEMISGEAGLQLGTDADSVPSHLGPVDFELGVIAGSGSINPFMSAMLPEPNDGKVSVESTRVIGMIDFLIVDSDHHYITEDELVIDNTRSFLQTGAFSGTSGASDN